MKNFEEGKLLSLICWGVLIFATLLANVGDTLTHATTTNIEPLPGFKPMQSMVFAGVFPLDPQDFQKLEEAIGRVGGLSALDPGIAS